jgi:hypothetical protein
LVFAEKFLHFHLNKLVTLKASHQELVLLHILHVAAHQDVFRLATEALDSDQRSFGKFKHGLFQ